MQRIIDAHHHIWQLHKNIRYPWLETQIINDFFLGDYQAIRTGFMITDLHAMIPKNYQLIGSIHCEAEAHREDSLKEAQWIEEHYKNNQTICGQSIWLDLSSSTVKNCLDEAQKINSVKGIRWKPVTAKHKADITSLPKKNTLLDDSWQSALSSMAEKHLLWELRVPAWHLKQASDCLENHPRLKVVLNHCGLPFDRTKEGISEWQQGMELLAKNPNVAVKLSELGTQKYQRERAQDKALIKIIIEIFGAQRCLFASNMPVSGLQISYQYWITVIDEVISSLCPENKQAIFWQNAMTSYGISQDNLPINTT